MTEVFSFAAGDLPLLISIPHDGRLLAPGQAGHITAVARTLPDTDWHVRKLYTFAAEIGANVIAANYSRYVVDLNRGAEDAALYEDQIVTGLFPTKTFAGEEIYEAGQIISTQLRKQRISAYWRPYHRQIAATLAKIRQKFGYALLWDAHSIASEVPKLFSGVLPDFNIGSNNGESCHPDIVAALMSAAGKSARSTVLDERFVGGFITRQYGAPEEGIHAIQLELAQHNYMDEKTFSYMSVQAEKLSHDLRELLLAFVQAGKDLSVGSGCESNGVLKA